MDRTRFWIRDSCQADLVQRCKMKIYRLHLHSSTSSMRLWMNTPALLFYKQPSCRYRARKSPSQFLNSIHTQSHVILVEPEYRLISRFYRSRASLHIIDARHHILVGGLVRDDAIHAGVGSSQFPIHIGLSFCHGLLSEIEIYARNVEIVKGRVELSGDVRLEGVRERPGVGEEGGRLTMEESGVEDVLLEEVRRC